MLFSWLRNHLSGSPLDSKRNQQCCWVQCREGEGVGFPFYQQRVVSWAQGCCLPVPAPHAAALRKLLLGHPVHHVSFLMICLAPLSCVTPASAEVSVLIPTHLLSSLPGFYPHISRKSNHLQPFCLNFQGEVTRKQSSPTSSASCSEVHCQGLSNTQPGRLLLLPHLSFQINV